MPTSKPYNLDSFLPILGSELDFQGTLIHRADPFQEITFSIRLHQHLLPSSAKIRAEAPAQAIEPIPSKRKYFDHKDLAAMLEIDPAHSDELVEYFATKNIKKTKVSQLSRTISFKGNIASINSAFKTSIDVYQGPNRFIFLAYKGPLQLPAQLQPLVTSVTGITSLLKSEFRVPTTQAQASETPKKTANKGYTLKQLAKAYAFPEDLDGEGQTIGIIELGGKYKDSDIQTYFKKAGLPIPKISTVGQLIDDSSLINNSEVTLDIQVVGAIAPKAHIVVYYGDTILEAMHLIINDKKNNPSVVSISWAGSEYNYSPHDIAELNELFFQAALLGITVVAASGDYGAMNNRPFLNVSIPSSNPLVVGCGGTAPVVDQNGEITSDAVWNQDNGKIGSGGGFSKLYPLPNFQKHAVINYPYTSSYTRGVPDIAANADGTNGYLVVFNGLEMGIGGTSASTPFFAALVALMNQSLGYRLGFINAQLYAFAGTEAFLPIVVGNNGHYPASPYWNASSGLGSPHGKNLLALFRKLEKTFSTK